MTAPTVLVDTAILGRQEEPTIPPPAVLTPTTPTSPRGQRQHHHHYQQQQHYRHSVTSSHHYDEKDQYYLHSPTSPNPASHYHHQPSFSSTVRSSRLGDSIDLEKQASKRQDSDERSSRRSSRNDGSKHGSGQVIGALYRVGPDAGSEVAISNHSNNSRRHHTIQHISDDDEKEEHVEPAGLANKGVKLLIFYIFLLPLLSITLTIWTILITPLLVLIHPIRLIITRRTSLPQSILSALGPALNLHLRTIHSFPTAPAELQLPQTLAVLLLATPFAFCLSLWGMLLSVYWLFAAIIGDPDGLDGRSDGRELVLTTRAKWDDWLRLSVRPEIRS